MHPIVPGSVRQWIVDCEEHDIATGPFATAEHARVAVQAQGCQLALDLSLADPLVDDVDWDDEMDGAYRSRFDSPDTQDAPQTPAPVAA